MAVSLNNLVSTYRIQFNKDFTFKSFREILPYLIKLGVNTIYASPIFEAVSGSVHGYDITNPNKINPEIGTEAELRELKNELRKNNMFWLQDIVPNHMAFHTSNLWLMDVLERGEKSVYSPFFDINWKSKNDPGRLMVPFLCRTLNDCIEKEEITIAIEQGRLVMKYFETAYPLNYKTYLRIFKSASLSVPEFEDSEPGADGEASSNSSYDQLYKLLGNNTSKIYSVIENINASKNGLKSIADEQFYRLCHWQETDKQINYRRFFTVNGLICLNIHCKQVFTTHHKMVLQLTREGIFDGLRVDHIDGLFDPTGYLKNLREEVGEATYIVVEKILGMGEKLPSYWPIQGNTGYDFLSISNNLFTNRKANSKLTSFYQKLTHTHKSFEQQQYEKKSYILREQMGGELENLYQLFLDLNLAERKHLAAIHPEDLKFTIGEFLIESPVYRYYNRNIPFDKDESDAIHSIFRRIKRTSDSPATVEILENCLLQKTNEGNEEYNQKLQYFYKRCMQFSGPLMAKGVEDTVMYTYNKFIGHNEVGDSPGNFGISADEFHSHMLDRLNEWPHSLNATATHDTKRGEDSRARLNTLTGYYEEWMQLVVQWREMNAPYRKNKIPDANDEYLIYQALIGSYPTSGQEESGFIDRFNMYLDKALREAKVHTNWTSVNLSYENGVKEFVSNILNKENLFLSSFKPFLEKVASTSIINSLSQVILKFTCPGIPDVYQGCELWDLSFVDPDNRRQVDFSIREEYLDTIENDEQANIPLLGERQEGDKIKLWVLSKLFALRKNNEQLFSEGEYLPLKIEGRYKDNIIAFARKVEEQIIVVVIPRNPSEIGLAGANVSQFDWNDTHVILPKHINSHFSNILTKEEAIVSRQIKLTELFQQVPFAILKGEMSAITKRAAGVLIHISSLPSAFAIGDMGPECRKFIDFLKLNKQKFWQLLPVNPTEEGQAYSPYSAFSSSAGNPLFISPELLIEKGLLDKNEIENLRVQPSSQVNFKEAEKIRSVLLDSAFEKFLSLNNDQKFEHFCKNESDWLNDFAFYSLLKHLFENKPWFEWPAEFSLKKEEALKKLEDKHSIKIKKIKWIQFVFNEQWTEVKKYSNSNKIKLIGDLPFYVSYDSADVWANKEIFSLDEGGQMVMVAGVPPDAFSSEGQLWGMPVYNWEALKSTKYKWWVDRIRRNRELFDIIRIDHFRAFADYWAVAAGEQSAINGKWEEGPGKDFFNSLNEQLGELPFIAEDLGEVNDKVFDLRDSFKLPGMKVLQFAFGEDMPTSDYIPHNYKENFVVYTGTHDNNTVKGWFTKEADDNTKKRIEQYLSTPVSENNIHQLLIRLAYSSTAKIVIIPMQDLLGLYEDARMNKPASIENNWSWKLLPEQLNTSEIVKLAEWTKLYNR